MVTALCPTLCDPLDCSPLGSSVHRISQARILEWVALPFSRGSSWPRDQTCIPALAGRFFTTEPSGKLTLKEGETRFLWISWTFLPFRNCLVVCASVKCSAPNAACMLSFQSCLTLCDPMDCSPPASSVHGILQASILEWVTIPFSAPYRNSIQPSCSY